MVSIYTVLVKASRQPKKTENMFVWADCTWKHQIDENHAYDILFRSRQPASLLERNTLRSHQPRWRTYWPTFDPDGAWLSFVSQHM